MTKVLYFVGDVNRKDQSTYHAVASCYETAKAKAESLGPTYRVYKRKISMDKEKLV